MTSGTVHRTVATLCMSLALGALPACSPAPESAATAVTAGQSSPGQAEPRQLGLCASCHGRDGIAIAANAPDLAGRDRDELLAAMQAYIDGTRNYPPMRAMLGPIAPAERERLAQWYADQGRPAGGDG